MKWIYITDCYKYFIEHLNGFKTILLGSYIFFDNLFFSFCVWEYYFYCVLERTSVYQSAAIYYSA